MSTIEGDRPTLKVISRILKEQINFYSSIVWDTLFVKLDFNENSKKHLLEEDIRNLKTDYIRKVCQYTEEWWPTV